MTLVVSVTQELARFQSTDSKLDNANLEAQWRGKEPSLCEAGSAFLDYVEKCNDCIDQNSDATKLSGQQSSDNSISQYLDFCNATEPTTTKSTAAIPLSWLTSYETFEPMTVTNLPISGTIIPQDTVVYKSIKITSTIPAYFFHVSVQSLISSYIPPAVFSDLAASAAFAASAASVTGDATSLIFAALEDITRPPWFPSAVPSTYVVEMSALEASINELRATPVPTTPVSTASESAAPSVNSSVQSTGSAGMLIAPLMVLSQYETTADMKLLIYLLPRFG